MDAVHEWVEYVAIKLVDTCLNDQILLEQHLSMNGYTFGFDAVRKMLFVFVDELDYVRTILEDRGIQHEVHTY